MQSREVNVKQNNRKDKNKDKATNNIGNYKKEKEKELQMEE